MGQVEKKSGKRLNKKAMAELLMELFQQNPDWEFTTKRIFLCIQQWLRCSFFSISVAQLFIIKPLSIFSPLLRRFALQ
jgi:hypothetical protein